MKEQRPKYLVLLSVKELVFLLIISILIEKKIRTKSLIPNLIFRVMTEEPEL